MSSITKVVALSLFVVALFATPVEKASAAGGHENNCQIVDLSYGWGSFYVNCGSGNIYAAFLPSSVNLPSGCTLTSDLDSIRIWLGLATAARMSDKTVTVWYTDICGGYARIIAAVEIPG